MQFILLAYALTACFVAVSAHMSMQFPYPRDTLSGSAYAVWQQNEPMWQVHPTTCHGLDEDATVRTGNTFSAGEFVQIDIYGSAPHDGGHCAFWWTTDTSSDWYKIIDIKDCTLAETFYVMMPYTMSTTCQTKCTFAFTWVPVSSGACEIYMNCAEISVSGVTGVFANEAITLNFDTNIINAALCQRVDTTTHFTTIFNDLKTEYTTSDTNGGATVVEDADEEDIVTVDETEISDGIEDATDELCANPNARDVDGTINTQSGKCSVAGSRCDDGQCCSLAGFCGPELAGYDTNGDPLYINYDATVTGNAFNEYYSSSEAAFAAYCTDNTGDWRLVSCSTLGADGSGSSTDDSSDITQTGSSGAVGMKLGKIELIVYLMICIWAVLRA